MNPYNRNERVENCESATTVLSRTFQMLAVAVIRGCYCRIYWWWSCGYQSSHWTLVQPASISVPRILIMIRKFWLNILNYFGYAFELVSSDHPQVWSPEQCVRVAAFNVSKGCRLICPGYGMMGLNNANYHDVKATVIPCVMIDPDGNMKVIEVPFHLALRWAKLALALLPRAIWRKGIA